MQGEGTPVSRAAFYELSCETCGWKRYTTSADVAGNYQLYMEKVGALVGCGHALRTVWDETAHAQPPKDARRLQPLEEAVARLFADAVGQGIAARGGRLRTMKDLPIRGGATAISAGMHRIAELGWWAGYDGVRFNPRAKHVVAAMRHYSGRRKAA